MLNYHIFERAYICDHAMSCCQKLIVLGERDYFQQYKLVFVNCKSCILSVVVLVCWLFFYLFQFVVLNFI
jgi:hypothetical protein